MSTIVSVAVVGCTLAAVATAMSVGSASRMQPHRAAVVRPAAVEFQFSVDEGESQGLPILSGQTAERLGSRVSFERHADSTRAALECTFESESLFDGTVLLRVHWREHTASGEHLRWEPTVRLRRGQESLVRMSWTGSQQRVLRVRGL
jgi:hypothetical protein